MYFQATFRIQYSRKHVPRFTRSMSPQDFPPSFNKQRQTDNYRNSQRKPQYSRQSDDVTERAWLRSGSRQSDDDDDWNTESPNLKQWEGDFSYIWENSQKSKQSDDDEDDWNTESSKLKQWDDRDSDGNSPWSSRKLRQSEDDTDSRIRPEGDDWSKYMEPNEQESFSDFSRNAKAVSDILNYLLPHIRHTLNISVTAEPLFSTAYFLMDYNHTYDKDLHLLRLEAVSKRAKDDRPYEVRITNSSSPFA